MIRAVGEEGSERGRETRAAVLRNQVVSQRAHDDSVFPVLMLGEHVQTGGGLLYFPHALPWLLTGEPRQFAERPLVCRDIEEVGHRRSLVMIGAVLLLINPVLRVAFAALGFAAQRDRLYTVISLFVLGVLLFSFFW